MLSDREQVALREIQRRLSVEEPDLSRSLRVFEVPEPARWGWVYTALVGVTGVLALGMVLAGAPGGAVAFAIAAVALWWTRRLEFATAHREGGD